MSHPVVRFGGEAVKAFMLAAAPVAVTAAHTTTIAATISAATAAATAAAPVALPVVGIAALGYGLNKLLNNDD